MPDTPELNFDSVPQFGPVLRADIRFTDFPAFCKHRRLLMVKVDHGFYAVDYRNPIPAPPDLWPVPVPEPEWSISGEQLPVDEPASGVV